MALILILFGFISLGIIFSNSYIFILIGLLISIGYLANTLINYSSNTTNYNPHIFPYKIPTNKLPVSLTTDNNYGPISYSTPIIIKPQHQTHSNTSNPSDTSHPSHPSHPSHTFRTLNNSKNKTSKYLA
jgi:hypothetical protein